MIVGLDSSFSVPTLEQARAAYAAGVRAWGGYFGSRDGLGLAVRWNRMSFWNIQQAGLRAIAFCSGWDDPDWIRQTAAEWGVLACVDVESGIREDGSWVMPWVQRAQSGLYGSMATHYEIGEPAGRGAQFNIMAWYPGYDPGSVWFDAIRLRPPGRCGWQWLGTHDEFGCTVDRGWYDDWFAGAHSSDEIPVATIPQAGGEGSMILLRSADGRTHRFSIGSGGSAVQGGPLGGPVRWAAVEGGAGGFTTWGAGDGTLPGGGGWIEAGTLAVCFDDFEGRERILIQGVGGDGTLYQKVVHTDDFSVAAEWRGLGNLHVSHAGIPGLEGPPGPPGPTDDAHIAEVAVRAVKNAL
jgi:hypothetical protein